MWLDQIADAAPEPHLRTVARRAIDGVLRGVVAVDRLGYGSPGRTHQSCAKAADPYAPAKMVRAFVPSTLMFRRWKPLLLSSE